jgi:dihydrofolate reductase
VRAVELDGGFVHGSQGAGPRHPSPSLSAGDHRDIRDGLRHDVRMGRLIYSTIASLDGYTEDESGDFQWSAPDGEQMAHVTEQNAPIGTYLYGRRMYETMRYWEHEPEESEPADRIWAAQWRRASKIVFSRTLDAVSTSNSRLEHSFDAETVRALAAAAPTDVTIGGPVVVGGGKPWLPAGVGLGLELVENRRFGSGAVFLRYRVASTRKRRE